METDSLRWFQQVADGVTVTEVAAIFRTTQPGVSRALARLDVEVGTPLLRRSGRVLRMTHAGVVFKRYVDALLHDLDDGLAAVDQLLDPERGTVALAYQLSLGTWLVPNLVEGFRRRHPEVRFVLQQVRDELVSSVLADPRVDLEVTALRPRDEDVAWHRLLGEPLCVALRSDHRLAAAAGVDLVDVADEPFVALRQTSLLRQQTQGLCEQAGFRPRVVLEGDDVPTVRAFVAAGLGLAVLPAARQGTPEAATEVLRHVPVRDPGATREVGLAHSVRRRLLPAADAFRAYVLQRAAAGDLPQAVLPVTG